MIYSYIYINRSLRRGELHFFDKRLRDGFTFDWYLRQMPDLEPGQITYEKTAR